MGISNLALSLSHEYHRPNSLLLTNGKDRSKQPSEKALANNLKTNPVEQALPPLPPASLPEKLSALCVTKEVTKEQEKGTKNSTRKLPALLLPPRAAASHSNHQTTN
jgi:hypothetical protein